MNKGFLSHWRRAAGTKRIVYPMIAFFLLTPFLLSCGGSSSTPTAEGTSGGNTLPTLSDFQAKLDEQNEATLRYVEKAPNFYSEMLFLIDEVDWVIADIDSDSLAEIDYDFAIDQIDSVLELLNDLSADLDKMIAPEMDLLLEPESFSASEHKLLKRAHFLNEKYVPFAADPFTIGLVCATALSIYSLHKAEAEAGRVHVEDVRTCYDNFYSQTSKFGYRDPNCDDDCVLDANNKFKDCLLAAKNKGYWTLLKAFAPTMILTYLPVDSFAAGIVSTYSTVADFYNVFIVGSKAESDPNETRSQSLYPQNNPGSVTAFESNGPMLFIAKTDETGKFTAPVGSWDIVAVKEGHARFGNRQGQPVTFVHGSTTQIATELVPLKEVSADEMNVGCQIPDGIPDSESMQYHVFKRSGLGYKKGYSGCATRMEGYDYFYQKAFPSEIDEIIAEKGNFERDNENACQGGPWPGPSPSFPAIWANGAVELVGSFDTFEEIDPYRCQTSQYDPRSVICTTWVHDLVCPPNPKADNYWDAIDSICGS